MATEVLWYVIPREGAYPWEPEGRRPVDLGYLAQLAGTVERLGYTGALLATDLYDVWPLGSALAWASFRELKPVQESHLPLWFGGSSDPGIEMAAEHVDVYLTWGEPPHLLKAKLERVRSRAAAYGRTLRIGLRLHLIVRDTEDEAWAAADRRLDVTYARQLGDRAGEDSVGWQRQFRRHGGKVPAHARELEEHPNTWPGMSLFRPGPGTAVVGSTAQVIERLGEFQDLGVDTFILTGNPLLEEAYRVAETALPALGVKS